MSGRIADERQSSRGAVVVRLVTSLKEPATQTDLLQVVKTTIAAVAAWVVADRLLGLSQAFLAPWAALLTVHATIYRTFSRGAQSVAATGLGLILSFAVVQVVGLGLVALGVSLLAGLLMSRAGLLRAEGVTIATTALFVLTTGYVEEPAALLDRVISTVLGVGLGLAVNLLVLAPLNNRSAAQRVDRIDRQMGRLLSQMAVELRSSWTKERSEAWIERTREMDSELDKAWQLVRHARESSRWNPRWLLSRSASDPTSYEQVLYRLEEGIAQVRSMARTIDEATGTAQDWDDRFSGPWIDILEDVGGRIAHPSGSVAPQRERLESLTRDLSNEDLPGLLWPTYGTLISNLTHVIDVVDDVATAQPVRT